MAAGTSEITNVRGETIAPFSPLDALPAYTAEALVRVGAPQVLEDLLSHMATTNSGIGRGVTLSAQAYQQMVEAIGPALDRKEFPAHLSSFVVVPKGVLRDGIGFGDKSSFPRFHFFAADKESIREATDLGLQNGDAVVMISFNGRSEKMDGVRRMNGPFVYDRIAIIASVDTLRVVIFTTKNIPSGFPADVECITQVKDEIILPRTSMQSEVGIAVRQLQEKHAPLQSSRPHTVDSWK